ncbi:hypothetical protein GS888_24600 [Rhodococcus hoagii]|nr:hypothetical protein [Prescottella equi]
MSTAEQIIAEHPWSWELDDIGSDIVMCKCGEVFASPLQHAAHVVAALTNAGYALVKDARVEYLLCGHPGWPDPLESGRRRRRTRSGVGESTWSPTNNEGDPGSPVSVPAAEVSARLLLVWRGR